MTPQQVYAVIRARSKYSVQQPRAYGPLLPKSGRAVPFPVLFSKGFGEYCVIGNENRYRLEDCNFFVHVDDGSEWPFAELPK